MRYNKIKSAFSFLEISIVILIVGLVMAMITQSSKLIAKSRLSSASLITANSPVPKIPGVIMWLETSSADSFAQPQSKMQDGDLISTWNDINVSSVDRHSATQVNQPLQPAYYENCINNLPCVRFNGTSTFLQFDGSSLKDSDYSLFVVEQRRADNNDNYFIGGSDSSTLGSLCVGYDPSMMIFMSHGTGSSAQTGTFGTFSGLVPRIHGITFIKGISNNYKYYTSGFNNITGTQSALASYNSANLGYCAAYSGYYNGDIGEVIILNRKVNETERKAIENYLSRKWKIQLY